MAASAARGSFGALFYVGSTTGVYLATTTCNPVPVGEITSLTMPTYTANSIDLTNQNTTEGFKEYVSGVRDPGSMSITANYLSSTTMHNTTIPFYFNNGEKLPWMIKLAGGSTANIWAGMGYITSYNIVSPPDGAVTFAATLKITGKPLGPLDSSTQAFATA